MAFDAAILSAPFRMQPGLSKLPVGQSQLTPNRVGDAHLAAKLRVLAGDWREALCCVDDWNAGPALAALSEHALLHHPDAWTRSVAACGSSVEYSAPLLGWGLRGGCVVGSGDPAIGSCLQSLPAEWRLAALCCLSFAEDLAVIDGAPGAKGRIPWLAVCLPSHWNPPDKLDKSFAQVHAPVADNALLIGAAAHLPQLVCGPQRWQRFVWTITPRAALDGHPLRQSHVDWPADASAAELAGMAWLRVEHQTFLPVAGHQQAVFTIKVDLHRLVSVVADPLTGAASRQALHAALASMSDAVLAYRGLDSARARLLGWLGRIEGFD